MTNSLLKNQKDIILELLSGNESIGVIVGEDQSIDSVAAGLGLYLVLRNSGKNVQIISKKIPNVEVSSLFGVDQIKKSFDGLTKILTISVPYREGEIEKVSYNIENDKLNVNLFAENSGISFSENEIDYIRKGSSPQVIVTIGVASEEELSGFVDPKSVKTIHIDRNPINPLLGDVALIDPSFSSLSEIVASLIMELSLGFDNDGFQNLMDGITHATRNFTLQTTSPFAFETAGYLLQNGAKRKDKAERSARIPDAPRNFPREEYFLNKKPRIQPNQPVRNNPPKDTPTEDLNTINQPDQKFNLNDPIHDDMQNLNMTKPSGEGEAEMPDEIPDDWFLPKVFKGSRKGN
jgi:hypothetical protein